MYGAVCQSGYIQGVNVGCLESVHKQGFLIPRAHFLDVGFTMVVCGCVCGSVCVLLCVLEIGRLYVCVCERIHCKESLCVSDSWRMVAEHWRM